ncbi:MAG: co-chaperone GroES [Planctomycetes bacterium]|nr:co-chaperone GroES [Planctomycetota bacterium]
MATKIRPLEDRIVVEPIEEESKTSGGIILPEQSKGKPTKGRVIAAGPGKISKDGSRIQLAIKTNDRILFSEYAGTDIKIGEKEYKIINESEILGILEE